MKLELDCSVLKMGDMFKVQNEAVWRKSHDLPLFGCRCLFLSDYRMSRFQTLCCDGEKSSPK